VREAYLEGGRLERVMFTTTGGALPPRDWLVELFAAGELGVQDRAGLLVGRALGRAVPKGPIICACLGVRADRISGAIAAGAGSVDAIIDVTGAGSNCGSCRPEIARLLKETHQREARHAA
jgi:assimilatory nitrate reductase catalytic subunit